MRLLQDLSQLSESELLYDWRFTANQFFLATIPWDSRPVYFLFQLNTCGYNPYVTCFLTREWVQNCCWTSPAESFSVPSLAGLVATFYYFRFEAPSTWRSRFMHLYPPRDRVVQSYPQPLGLLFFASYDSQGYAWGIPPRQNTEVGFEVLTAVVMNSSVFLNITPSSPLNVNWQGVYSTTFRDDMKNAWKGTYNPRTVIPTVSWSYTWIQGKIFYFSKTPLCQLLISHRN
jgi:hypothetical protein